MRCFSVSLLRIAIWSCIWSSLAMSITCFLHVLVLACVASFIGDSSFIWSMRLACRIFFILMVYSIGMLPVSFRRIVVGVPLGRNSRVFVVSLNMHCSLLFSSLLVVHPSHAYVIMGMMMASTICHIACILIPLNSLFPVSAIILSVAPLTFLSISAIWTVKLPLLFIISPRYLYVGTSSSVSPFSVSELVFPFPLFITLHLAAPNWMCVGFHYSD